MAKQYREIVKNIAVAIQRAIEIRENSWHSTEQKYKINEDEAFKQSFQETFGDEPIMDLWYPMFLANHWQNDQMEWCKAVIEGTFRTTFFENPESEKEIVHND